MQRSNCVFKLDGSKLLIEVDLTAEGWPSERHPDTTVVVASTGGFATLGADPHFAVSVAVTRRRNGLPYRGRGGTE